MKVTNKFNLPQPVVTALNKDDYDSGGSHRSITQLIDSPRVSILRKEFDEDRTEDVSDKLWSVLGTAVHKMFEDTASGDYISEERIHTKHSNWDISGAIDLQLIEPDGVTLIDYKCTSVWSVIFDKPEWHNQLNAYAWLVRRSRGLSVKTLQICAVLRDWKQRDAESKQDYPKAPLVVIDIPVWDDEKQDEYMDGRIKLHSEAEFARLTGERLPPCSTQERWGRDPTYAVKKDGRKTAVRVFNSDNEARAYIGTITKDQKKHSVEHRPGEMTRCKQDWCGVAMWCDQYQGES